jgi:hypothetical protein
MATLPEIRYAILDRLRGGLTSDDELLSNREVDFLVHNKRARLIKEYLQKNRDAVHPEFLQEIKCYETVLADKSECCDIQSDCLILKTKYLLPSVYNNLFAFIGPIDRSQNFQLVSANRSVWDAYGRFTAKLPKVYYLNNRLYITNNKTIEYIRIAAVFENPVELSAINSCNGVCYDEMTSKYPLPNYLVDLLIQLVVADLAQTTSTHNDEANDTRSGPRTRP